MSAKLTDPAIAAELRRIRREHPEAIGRPDAHRVMARLASLWEKYRQLDAVIKQAGGPSEETKELVAELRQLSKACSALELQLAKPNFETDRPQDALVWMAATRKALIERARARQALEGQATPVPEPAEQPLSGSALLRRLRDDRDLDG